ncbi:MAG: murein hydrolase activator EnvC family protein [Burkholderiales bacterium]
MRASEAAISDSNRSLRALDAQARAARDAIAQLQARQRALGATLAQQKEALGRLLAARALERMSGGVPELVRLALAGEDANDVARNLVYLSLLSRAAAGVIESHRAGLGELDRLRADSEEKVREAGRIEALQRTDRERILAERRERRRVLDRIGAELRSGRKEMRTLIEDEQKLALLAQGIGRFLAERPGAGHRANPHERQAASPAGVSEMPFAALRGKLAIPVVGELLGRLHAQSPGAKGIFVRAREGEAVRAVAAGRVVYADWMRGFGNLLIVDHGEAYLSIYGNNESLLKQPGEAVVAGEAVATAGASGGNRESGLYFELRHLGKAFDPLRWLKRN